MVWSPTFFLLYGVLIALVMMGAGVYFYKGKQKDIINERLMLYGFGCLSLSQGLGILFSLIAIMYYPGIYENYSFYVNEYNLSHPLFMHNFFFRLWAFSIMAGYAIFCYTFERVVKRTRYLLTITCIALIIFHVIFGTFISFEISDFILYNFTLNFMGFLILLIIVIYTRLSRLEGKAVGSFFYLGTALWNFGDLFWYIRYFYVSAMILNPLLHIIAVFMFLVPLVINPKYLTQALKYWHICWIIIAILFFGSWGLFVFIYEIPYYPTLRDAGLQFLVWGIIHVIMYFFLYRSIKYEKPLEDKEDQSKGFGVLVKPQRITEEEVSVSKEKKICLVCKGKVGRFMFMCPDCNTFYCENCARALSDLENACWVCDTPFDKSKPSTPFKKEAEKIEISDKPQK